MWRVDGLVSFVAGAQLIQISANAFHENQMTFWSNTYTDTKPPFPFFTAAYNNKCRKKKEKHLLLLKRSFVLSICIKDTVDIEVPYFINLLQVVLHLTLL